MACRTDRPVQRTREIVEICRMIWRREEIRYDGRAIKLPLPAGQGTGLGKPLKILTHLGARPYSDLAGVDGRSQRELTAELAEGWLPIFFVPEKADLIWGAALDGALRNGRRSWGRWRSQRVVRWRLVKGSRGCATDAAAVGAVCRRHGCARQELLQRPDSRCTATSARRPRSRTCICRGRSARPRHWSRPICWRCLSLIGPEGYVKDRIAAHRAAESHGPGCEPVGPGPFGDVARASKNGIAINGVNVCRFHKAPAGTAIGDSGSSIQKAERRDGDSGESFRGGWRRRRAVASRTTARGGRTAATASRPAGDKVVLSAATEIRTGREGASDPPYLWMTCAHSVPTAQSTR